MKNNLIPQSQKGASIIEVLIATLLIGILLATITLGFTNVARSEKNARVRGQAINMARESLEAVYSLSEANWDTIGSAGPSNHKVVNTGGEWQLQNGAEDIDGYTRKIIITSVQRDANNNIDFDGSVDAGDYTDNNTKLITVTITWVSFGKTFDYSQSTILSNWKAV